MCLVVHVEIMVEKRGACKDMVGKTERRTQFGRPRHRWENIIKTGLQKIVREGVD